MDQQPKHYQQVAAAIEYIQQHFKQQPSLEEIANHVHLSPFHFQRLFEQWAGVSPKKFLQYISIEYAKALLNKHHSSVLDATYETGFSSTSRLHDLFINIEGMTPAEYKNGGQQLHINYQFSNNQFGHLLIASTTKGVCYLAFIENKEDALLELKGQFPHAHFSHQTDPLQDRALQFFSQSTNNSQEIKLHLKGTDFQLKIWQCLLSIPQGELSTYGRIADTLGNPKASRAVGTAIGHNPVAVLIPCHRVIRSSGVIEGYRWGSTRKRAIIAWEAAQQASTKRV